jgi:L-fuculose-phosphate aldolase
MTIMYAETRERIAELGKLMFDRKLSDTAGGNISVRVGEHVCITPRFAGSKHQWNLRPEQVLVTKPDGTKLEGEGEISREAKVHYALLNAFPESGSVVHGHARNVMVFCCANLPMPPVMEATQKYGEIKIAPYATAHSGLLAKYLLADFTGQEDRIKSSGAAVMAAYHGLFVLGRDIETAFDVTERLDRNAYIILQARNLLPAGSDAGAMMSKTCGDMVTQFKAEHPA